MTQVSETDQSADSGARSEGGTTSKGSNVHRSRRWPLWGGALVVVLAAGLWYGLGRGGGPTVTATVTDCSQGLHDPNASPPVANLRPAVVGLGAVASLAAFDTTTGWVWCFDGMGSGTDGISRVQMHAAVGAPVAVVDGSLTSDVLMLVHLARHTTSVVVTTANSRSFVIGRGEGFEVLRIPMTKWPPWHAPWIHRAIALGRIIGFDDEGRVTSSQPFTWCPGAINTTPGGGC
jgi:hypothetical protein